MSIATSRLRAGGRVAVNLVALLIGPLAPASPPAPGAQTPTLLRFAAIVDGTGERLAGREILVADGVILAVGDDLRRRHRDARSVDLGRLTAIPGLIDAHLHITYGFCRASRGDAWAQLLQHTPPQERLVAAIDNAARTLATGVTSARDLFALDHVDFYLRDLIERGIVPGPRLFLSGKGIHPLVMPPSAAGSAAERVAALRTRANEVADSGAEWLKIFATTGTGSDLTGERVYGYPELAAAVEAARARGLKTAVHAYGPSAVPDAIRARVASIEHAVDVDDATLEAWAASGIFYVPTIDHNRYYAEHASEYGYDEQAARALRAFLQRNVDMLRRAHAAGVRIAMGSDAVMTMFGENTRELEWFVEAGMTPAEALRTATVNGARLLGQDGRLGRLAPGFLADIVAIDGEPLEDIQAVTRRVRWVMKGGEIVVDRRGGDSPSPGGPAATCTAHP